MSSNSNPHPEGWSRRAVQIGAIVISMCHGCEQKQTAIPPPPAIEVTVSQPLSQEITDSLEFTGTTAPVGAVEVRSRVTGFLQKVHFRAPVKVKQGEVLFTIDPRTFKNRVDSNTATLDSKKALLPKAEFDAKKLQSLFDKGNAAQDELIAALAVRDSLQAEISKMQAEIEQSRLELEWCQVTAPISGRISRNWVDPGNVISADVTMLAQIVDDDTIYAYFNGSEQDILVIRERTRQQLASEGKTMTAQPDLHERKMPVFLGLMNETGFPHGGVIDYAAPGVDPTTGTIQIRGRFENEDASLVPGLFVRVKAPVSKPYAALMVTERALGSDQGQRYLLVVNTRNVVEYRPVQVGALENGLRVIRSGVAQDERVIVDGIQRVRPGLTVKPVPAPMPVLPATSTEGKDAKPTSAAAKENGN